MSDWSPSYVEFGSGDQPGSRGKADALLIDEKDGRRAALARGLTVVGTTGLLELAAERRLVILQEIIERMRLTNPRVHPSLLDAPLERQRRREQQGPSPA